MKWIAPFLALAVLGCVQTPPMLSIDPRIAIAPDADVIVTERPVLTISRTGTIDVSIKLENKTGAPVTVQCVADWFDAYGHPVDGLSAAPARITVGGRDADYYHTVSPTRLSHNFHVSITPGF